MTPETNAFDTTILRKAGLTESQAKGYLALIEHGKLTPAELADKTGESRTNGYMICEKLESLGLASKKSGNKAHYSPNHPSALETLAERRRKVLVRNELEVKQSLSPLIDMFYSFREEPSTRVLQGLDGIKTVYDDTLRVNDKAIYFLRSVADGPTLGDEYFKTYRQRRTDAGIDTYALTPMTTVSHQHVISGDDVKMRVHRTPLPAAAYTAPVEIDVYGNKVALINFGETQMATIITSPPIAEAMRQLFQIIISAYSETANTSQAATGDSS